MVDLFEKCEPDARELGSRLDDDIMMGEEWRIGQLSRLWALVAHWHAAGMPRAGTVMQTYERYGEMLGGIVESAGYAAPFQAALIPDAISPEKGDFQKLLVLMLAEMAGEQTKDFTLVEMARIARKNELFEKNIGTVADGIRETIKKEGLGKDERLFAVDKGYLSESYRVSFGKVIKDSGRVGQHPVVDGKKVEFGKREQARHSTYTFSILPR